MRTLAFFESIIAVLLGMIIIGAGFVVHAKPDAVAIAKIKFREIAVKVLLFAVLIHTLHSVLEDRIIAFNGWCANLFTSHQTTKSPDCVSARPCSKQGDLLRI